MSKKSNFIVRGGADFSGIKKGLDQTQKQLANFQGGVNKSMQLVATALSTLAVGSLIKDSTKMAMGVEGALGNISRNMGSASDAFDKFVKTQSRALGMAKSDAYQYGSTFSNLLSSFSADTKETASNTQELMRAAAIIASKTGRTYEDTAERIRSGMLGSTEAIEDLGVYTNVSMIESTKAFKKFANGKSWAQLDFQTQQQIRLAAILEQTYARYGDTLADNTQTKQARFIACLNDLKLTIGEAFLPIYNFVLPGLTALTDALRTAVLYVQAFFQALFGGKSATSATDDTQKMANGASDTATGLKDANDETDELKKKLAGFDDLNILSDNKSSAVSSSTDATTGTTGDSSAQTELTKEYEERMTKLNEGLESFKSKLQEISPVLKVVTALMVAMWAAFVLPTALVNLGAALTAIGSKLPVLGGMFTGLGNTIKAVGLAFSSIPGIILLGVIVAIIALIAIIADLWKNSESFRNFIIQCWTSIKTAFQEAANYIWVNGLKPLLESLGITADSFSDLYTNHIRPAMEEILKVVVGSATTIITSLINLAAIMVTSVLQVITAAIEVLKPLAIWLWENFLKPLGEWTGGIVVGTIELIASALSKISDWVSNNRELVKGMQIVVLGFVGAWKVTQLLAFIQMSGGLTGALNSIKKALELVSLAKAKDGLATMYLTALYAKDFLVSIGSTTKAIALATVKWAANTIAVGANKVALAASAIAQGAMTIATGAWTVVCGIATGVTTAFGAAVAFLTSPIGLVIMAITALVSIVVLLIKNWDKVKEVATNTWATITKLWSQAPGFFSKMLGPVKKVFETIFGAIFQVVTAPVQIIVSMINLLIEALNKIKVPDWVPGVGGKGFDIPKIPKLAKGGIVGSGQLFMAGEAGKEAIVPLERNTEWINELANKINGSSGGNITINATGDTAALIRFFNFELSKDSQLKGTRLINGVI